MTYERVVTLAVWLFLVAGGAPALAQGESVEEPQPATDQSQAERLAAARREKAQNLTPARVSSGEARLRGIEKSRFPFSIFQQGFHGFRPVMGGMPSGSGFVVGGGYVRGLESEVFTVSADARYSTRGFKQADVRLALPTAQSGRPIRAFLNASYQDYPGLRFFGLGNDSGSEDRVFFGQKNQIFGGGVTAESHWVDLSVEANRMTIETGSANRDPSVEAVFPVRYEKAAEAEIDLSRLPVPSGDAPCAAIPVLPRPPTDPDVRVLPHPAPRQMASLRAVAYPLVQEARRWPPPILGQRIR